MKILMPLLCLSALLLSGCASDNEDHVSGIEGTGNKVEVAVAYGSITGFGSVYVNGVHFSTDSTMVEIDGEPATEGELSVGMVVEVVGEINSDGREGVATAIYAERVLLGTVDAVVDVAAGRRALKLLGQTVYVAEDAEFSGTDFARLEPGLDLSVSGYVAENGYITATFLEQQTEGASKPRIVEGYITALDSDSLSLLDLNVDIRSASIVGGSPADITVGARIKVIGEYDIETQVLLATQLVFKPQRLENGHYSALEGVVHEVTESSTFWVRDTAIDMQNAVFENGVASDISNGARVVVFGRIEGAMLVAERIVIKSFNTNRFSGAVEETDFRAGTFRLHDTVFHMTAMTQFKDDSRFMARYFDLEDLHIGEDVEVFAVQLNGQWQVTRVVRQDTDMNKPNFIRGNVSLIEGSLNFYIGDILVDGSDLSASEWDALNEPRDGPITADLEGFYTGDLAFKAVRIRLNSKYGCDQHVFFRCADDNPFDDKPFDDHPFR